MSYMLGMEPTSSSTRAEAFLKVLKGLLRPLVRALISQGVTAPVFYRLVKQTYVDVAGEVLDDGKGAATDSRISVITGVHRRDVKTMRTEDQTEDAALRARVSTLSSVLGRWLGQPDFTNKDGSPKAIPRFGSEGPTFETLVQSVSRDVRPRTVLDEMIRQKLAVLNADETVTLMTGAIFGPADLDQRVHFFSSNVGDHLAAAVENLVSEEKPPFMERAVFYNRLGPGSVDTIEAAARDEGNALLLKLNKEANALQTQDKANVDATHRFRFGMFFYREDEPDPSNEDNGK